jgi:hypothetical protein
MEVLPKVARPAQPDRRREARVRLRQAFLVFVPIVLVIPTLFEAIAISHQFYEDQYRIPLEKFGVLTAIRWQDLVFITGFWIVVIAILRFVLILMMRAIRMGSSRVIS